MFFSPNETSNVEDIVNENEGQLALRLSGQLLLGVVRIYNRKAKYLLADCTDAISQLRLVN